MKKNFINYLSKKLSCETIGSYQQLIRMLYLVVILQCLCFSVFAQQKVIGNIKAENGDTMEGVSISIKGTTNTTQTDAGGNFVLNVPAGAVLEIRYLGYKTQEITVGNRNNISLVLKEDTQQLNDVVVVTALGVQRKTKALTYSVQTIKSQEITEIRDADVVNTLQGKVVGAVIQQGSGGLGSATSLVLRGNRSLAGSSAALFVVDGVPMNNFNFNSVSSDFGSGYTGVNGTTTINPDDIESTTVLRGASASALYGSAAANGVVLITTKKGKSGKVSIDINSGVSSQSVWGLQPLQNEYGQGIGNKLDPSIGASWGEKMNGQKYTNHLGEGLTYTPQKDNVSDFFKRGINVNNSIGISTGTEKTQTFFSYANTKSNGMIPLNKLQKHSVNLRITNQLTSRLSFDGKVNYVNQRIEHTPVSGENNAPLFNAYQMPRSMPIDVVRQYTKLKASGIEEATPWASTLNSIYQNPYWALNGVDVTQPLEKVTGFLTSKFQLSSWLSIQGRANLEKTSSGDEMKVKDGVFLYSQNGGKYKITEEKTASQWYDAMLLGSNKINKNWLVSYQAGAIFNDYIGTGLVSEANGLIITNKYSLSLGRNRSINNSYYHVRSNAIIGQSTFSFKDAIFIDGSIRNEWNSTLPASNRSYPYGSIGISTILSDLVTLPKFVSFLKVNGSHAQVGNAAGAYQLNTTYSANSLNSLGVGYLERSRQKALSDLKPELTKSNEASVDVRFLDNRIGVEATLYKTNSTNQIILVNLPPATGFASQRINAGNIENRGLELLVNATPVQNKSFSWNLAFNYGKNKNKVVALSETFKRDDGFIRMSGVSLIEGEPQGQVYAYGWDQNAKGDHLVTDAGVPVITNEPKYIGNLNPKAVLGLTNNFKYKDLSLRVLVNGRIGGVFVSGNEGNLAYSGIAKVTENNRSGNWTLDAVTSSGDVNTKAINSQDFWTTVSGQRYGAGEFFSYDATNFRLRELSLGYKLPTKNNHINNIRVALFASNLFWIYRGESLLDIPSIQKRKLPSDPDMTLGGLSNGSDYGVFPSSRQFGLNLQFSFN